MAILVGEVRYVKQIIRKIFFFVVLFVFDGLLVAFNVLLVVCYLFLVVCLRSFMLFSVFFVVC